MPDTTVREGWLAEYMGERRPWVAYKSDAPESPHDVPCVVVTGRTAQDVEKALALLDTRYAMEERLSQFQNAAAALIREIDRA